MQSFGSNAARYVRSLHVASTLTLLQEKDAEILRLQKQLSTMESALRTIVLVHSPLPKVQGLSVAERLQEAAQNMSVMNAWLKARAD
jgi:hypothetical protein